MNREVSGTDGGLMRSGSLGRAVRCGFAVLAAQAKLLRIGAVEPGGIRHRADPSCWRLAESGEIRALVFDLGSVFPVFPEFILPGQTWAVSWYSAGKLWPPLLCVQSRSATSQGTQVEVLFR